jgi:hypothetical protein
MDGDRLGLRLASVEVGYGHHCGDGDSWSPRDACKRGREAAVVVHGSDNSGGGDKCGITSMGSKREADAAVLTVVGSTGGAVRGGLSGLEQ